MPIADDFGSSVAARLLDFFAAATPWQRRLWMAGVALSLEEVLEASIAARAGILDENSLMMAQSSAQILSGPDLGVGTLETKRALNAALKRPIVPEGYDYSTVNLLLKDIKLNYLQWWAEALD